MTQEQFIKSWKKFLIDIGRSETALAKENNKVPSNLNRSLNSGSIKYLELAEIVEQYGYSIEIHKKETFKPTWSTDEDDNYRVHFK